MRKWVWIAPIFLLAACSRDQSQQRPARTQTSGVAQAATLSPAPNAPPAEIADASAPGAPSPAAVDPSAPAPASAEPAVVGEPAPTPAFVIPQGTLLRVRVDESLSTRRNLRGDRFTATLTAPVVVDGHDVLPAGTRLAGHVLVSKPSGRLKGRAELELALDSFVRDGHRYPITTSAAARVSRNHKKRNLVAIGGGAGTGAAIGAIAGGGVGAAIGAGAGAVAGTVGAAITGKKQVTIPAESIVRFRLGEPVRV